MVCHRVSRRHPGLQHYPGAAFEGFGNRFLSPAAESTHHQRSKCEFLKHELEFLGHVISINDVKIDPKKIAAIQD
ncbi:hypothetical protein CLOM_g2294 [Closterium sp. NIES-68]|nr:hypothetical protein CLOM_g2294 [Closterium sp. NIES-68]